MVVNTCHDGRRSGLGKKEVAADDEQQRDDAAPRPEPRASVAHPSLRLALERALAKLTRHQRDVFLLYEVEGFRHAEISSMLEISEAAAKNTLFQAKKNLRSWKSLRVAAAELGGYTESPALWPRIRHSLTEQAASIQKGRERWSWRSLFAPFSFSWQTAAATAFVAVLMISAGWLLRPNKPPIQEGSLLKSKALTEVEHAESAYVQAIERLAADAKPQTDNPATPLMGNYRETLLVLAHALDDARAPSVPN